MIVEMTVIGRIPGMTERRLAHQMEEGMLGKPRSVWLATASDYLYTSAYALSFSEFKNEYLELSVTAPIGEFPLSCSFNFCHQGHGVKLASPVPRVALVLH